MNVAIVDDDPDVRTLLGFALDEHNTVVEFGDGQAALAYDGWDLIDAAIIDVMMPGIDGGQVVVWLEANHPRVRRIICTAKPVDQLDADRFLLAHEVIQKPWSHDMLEAAIHG